MAEAARWLLIGNSRWHWAETGADGGLSFRHQAPPAEAGGAAPLAWAAVGPVVAGPGLPPERRLVLAQVPLAGAPPGLGIDRALAAWWAWRQLGAPVLVADCGTVLSLTRVDRQGCFAGGRLQAGLALQLRAMAAGTVALPELRPEPMAAATAGAAEPAGAAALWPAATAAAMAVGVEQGLAAAVAAAARQAGPGVRLVLTGGDAERLGPLLAPLLAPWLAAGPQPAGGPEPPPLLWPHLCLEALVALRPAPGR